MMYVMADPLPKPQLPQKPVAKMPGTATVPNAPKPPAGGLPVGGPATAAPPPLGQVTGRPLSPAGISQGLPTPLQAAPAIKAPPQMTGGLPPQVKTGATPPPPAGQAGKAPVPAQAKKSLFKFLPLILGGLILLAVIIFAASRLLGGGGKSSVSPNTSGSPSGESAQNKTPTKQTILTYWGLWEPDQVLTEVFEEFSQKNPGVIVQYKKQSHREYRERLQASIAAGSGPDIFRYHASWVPMIKAELDVLPSSIMSASQFSSTFYPAAVKQLQVNGKPVGIPLMYDGLALYYNQQALETAAIDPPRTWTDLRVAASKLTIRSGNGIERAGLAAGNATNVDHFSDIVGLLMLQNGADPSDPTSKEATEALVFYTDFVKKDQVWNETLPSSTIAFARGDVAMMFAPSWRAHEIQQLNPDLKFKIISVPKLAGANLGWASFWAEGVSAQSKNKDLAWKLLQYLSTKEVQQKLYSKQAQTRSFGEIYSRVDLADQLAKSEYVSAYLEDAPKADSWYLNSMTHDNGLNDQLISYYQDAVTAILNGKKMSDVTQTLSLGTSQILRQYGVQSAGGSR